MAVTGQICDALLQAPRHPCRARRRAPRSAPGPATASPPSCGAAAPRRSLHAECRAPGRRSGRARDGGRCRLGRRRSRRAGSRGRARRGRACPADWSRAAAISSAPRNPRLSRGLVRERRVERVRAVRESVHRGRAELWLRRARHLVRVGDHQRGPDAGGRVPALGQPVDRGHRRARERRRDGRDLAAANCRDRLRRVDHPPATEGDEALASDVVDDRTGCFRHPRPDEVGPFRALAEAGRIRQGARRRKQLEFVPPLLGEGSERIGDGPSIEEQAPPVVGELDPAPPAGRLQIADGQEPGVGLEPTASPYKDAALPIELSGPAATG